MFIREFAEGCCDECGQTRKGVHFSHFGTGAFLCWEHFRLAAPALRGPQPAVIRETLFLRGGHCRCHCTCSRYAYGETFCSSSVGYGRSESYGWSAGDSRGQSRGESISHSGFPESRSESRSKGAQP